MRKKKEERIKGDNAGRIGDALFVDVEVAAAAGIITIQVANQSASSS